MDADDDLFDDLYDGEADGTNTATPSQPAVAQPDTKTEEQHEAPAPATIAAPSLDPPLTSTILSVDDTSSKPFDPSAGDTQAYDSLSYEDKRNRPVQLKDDGKMFIGGLNWETTDQSLKDYFTQFGEVTECTVMRDGATGRSRGFGFLTFRDPKVVNVVMLQEHILDGKLIDPKRAIPRDEQEKTSKIFVGGVSQEATEKDFKEYFEQFGRVLDATLMMDKDTGRPRGFGFVTFDNDAAVDNTLASELVILGKPIEVKRAQPRNNVRDEDDSGGGRGGRFGGRGGRGGYQNNFSGGESHAQQSTQGQSNMTPAQMATMWMNMQNIMRMAQQNAMQNNPAMMQQMMMMQQAQNNPAAMQQMMQQFNNGGYPQSNSPSNGGPGQNRGNMSPQQDQQQDGQGFDRQQIRMQQQNFDQGGAWEGMYDGEPAPVNHRGGRGGYRGGRGGGNGYGPGQAPAGAPTGPKNAGRPGANYRGGGRGGRAGWHPYASRGG